MHLWLRPQFSPETGLGHLMRAVAVAEEASRRRLDVTFVPHGAPGGLSALPGRYGFAVAPAGAHDDWLAAVLPGDVVLFDGYEFTVSDHRAAAARGAVVGAVDDFGTGSFAVDVLVNPNPVASPRYEIPAHAALLVGPRFAMVRSGFVARRRVRHDGGTNRLVVVLGGSDATGLTPVVVECLRRSGRFEHVVLLRGPAAAPVATAEGDAGWLEVVHDPADVAGVLAGADAAVAAAGTSTWELLTLGVPTALVQVADNQRHVIAIAEAGCALSLGSPEELERRLPDVLSRLADPSEQRRLSAAACRAVDGLGAGRVLSALAPDG